MSDYWKLRFENENLKAELEDAEDTINKLKQDTAETINKLKRQLRLKTQYILQLEQRTQTLPSPM